MTRHFPYETIVVMENNIQQKDQLHSVSSTVYPNPSKTFIILLVVMLIVIVGVGGYILGANQNQIAQNQTPPATLITQPSPTLTPDPTAAWKTYRNEEIGFEFKYPPDWSLIDEIVMPTSYVERCRNAMSKEKDFDGCLWLGSVAISENPFGYYNEHTDRVTKEFIEDLPQERIGDRIFYVFHDIFEAVGTNAYYTRGPDQKYYRVVYWQRYPIDPYQNYDSDENLQGIIRQILSTFRFIENEKEILGLPWKSVCAEIDNKPFMVSPEKGQGLTHIGRKAVQDYINQANLLGIPDKFPSVLTTQRVYAEDYIKDYLVSKGVSANNNIEIPCELVEVALMASTKLIPAQQENLEAYARRSIGLSRLREIQEIIEKATEGTLKPYIIVPPKSIN